MSNPVRNIIIAHYRPDIVSGAENSIADLADQLDERFQVTMLVPGEGNLARFYRERGCQVWARRVEGPRRLMPGVHKMQSLLLARSLKQRRVDAVLCNTFPSASRVGTACQMAHIPYAIYMRDYTPDTPLHRKIINRANVLFAISQDVIQQHSRMAAPGCFRLAYNYIDPKPILERQKKHLASGNRAVPFDSETPVIGLVGRLTPYKQPDLFIRAAAHVLRAHPEARFVLIGSAQEREKPFEDSLHALATELGVSTAVYFLGQRKDAVELTSEFTIACLASSREPLGRVVLEAQLLGVPVIVPDSGGPAELVEDGVSGLHFRSTAPDAEVQLARQISYLLDRPDRRDCLASKARESVMGTFASLEHVRIQEVYFDELCTQGHNA